MRKALLVLPVLLIGVPAEAQSASSPLPPELTDPRTAHQLANAMQAVSQALLDVRVGSVRAAIEGRDATPAERRMTVRDMARRDDPDFDRHMAQNMASVGPALERGMTSVNRAIPAMQQAVNQLKHALDRATANLPDPTYPRR